MSNVLEKEMTHYFRRLNEVEKQSVVKMLKTFLLTRKEEEEFISIEQYNLEIDKAMEDVKNGDVVSHEEVVKMAKDR